MLSALDVLALPCTFEGFGIVQTEAIDDGVTGFLVAFGDVDALADRMRWLLEDSDLRQWMAWAGRSRVERKFTGERMAVAHEQLYFVEGGR